MEDLLNDILRKIPQGIFFQVQIPYHSAEHKVLNWK